MRVSILGGLLVSGVGITASATPDLPRPDHIVIVIEENHSYSDVVGYAGAPYFNSLASTGANLTDIHALTRPSQPNYLNLFSGSDQGVTSNSIPVGIPFSTPNLGAALRGSGYTFTGFCDGMPSVGYQGASFNAYQRKHNPWANWQDDTLPTPPNRLPSSVNQPFTSFPTDFSLLPTVSIVVPDQNHDMHDGTITAADTWMHDHLDAYRAWAQTHNSLLITTWDEDDFTLDNHIPTFFNGPMVVAGDYSTNWNHFNLLRTIEDMYDLPHSGAAASAAPITGMWIVPEPGGISLIALMGALARRRLGATKFSC